MPAEPEMPCALHPPAITNPLSWQLSPMMIIVALANGFLIGLLLAVQSWFAVWLRKRWNAKRAGIGNHPADAVPSRGA